MTPVTNCKHAYWRTYRTGWRWEASVECPNGDTAMLFVAKPKGAARYVAFASRLHTGLVKGDTARALTLDGARSAACRLATKVCRRNYR